MRNTFPASFLIVVLMLVGLSGCTVSRLLKDHKKDINRLLAGDLSEQEQFDGLATELVQVMGEALDLERPSQQIKYLRKFSQQNDAALKTLFNRLNPWVSDMNTIEKVAFAARGLLQPYGRELVTLVPRVQRLMETQPEDLGTLEKLLILYQLKKVKQ